MVCHPIPVRKVGLKGQRPEPPPGGRRVPTPWRVVVVVPPGVVAMAAQDPERTDTLYPRTPGSSPRTEGQHPRSHRCRLLSVACKPPRLR